MKILKSLIFIVVFSPVFLYGQSFTSVDTKLKVGFHENIELFWFVAYIAYETAQIETKTIRINDKPILEKEWEAYGYYIYKKYKSRVLASKHLQKIAEIAAHLSYVSFTNLLLRVDKVPQAKLPADLHPSFYLSFSKTKNPEEARKNVKIFLTSFNALYKELKFDEYLKENKVYYDKVLEEIKNALPKAGFINHMETFLQKKFEAYILIPSLTMPKSRGYASKNGQVTYNVFGAVDYQKIDDTKHLKMGFANTRKVRELSIHEFGHSFINPEVAKLAKSYFENTRSLFTPIKKTMYKQAYPNWEDCVYEHFVRAMEVIMAEKYASKEAYENLKKEYIEEKQFIYIPKIVGILKNYAKEGSLYDAIKKAMLVLEKLAKSKD